MGFVNLSKLAKKYTAAPMQEVVENLVDFDAYHCLLAGSMSAALRVQSQLEHVPGEVLEWLKLCDGGLLFDTVLLSTKGYDSTLELEFDTYQELNSPESLANLGLPQGYAVFAFRSYGDPLCLHTQQDDDKIYLWDVEKREFAAVWDSFSQWMEDEVDEAVGMIADGLLEPLGVKIGGDEDA